MLFLLLFLASFTETRNHRHRMAEPRGNAGRWGCWDRAATGDSIRNFVGDTMDLARQLRDYRLTTAEILYHLPDHPGLLQSYVWQELDIAPNYPVLRRFLDFWQREIEARVHSVRVASAAAIKAAEWRHTTHELRLQ